MFELQIVSPRPEQRFPSVIWNYEQLKQEIAAAVKIYENLTVTPETEKDCKETRAQLNKLRTAIETARKEVKAKISEPLKKFEAEVKDVEAPIDSAIAGLDKQLAELKEIKQKEKAEKIQAAFAETQFPAFVTLEQIFRKNWLNASCSIPMIRKDLEEIRAGIEKDLKSLQALPKYGTEAVHFYEKSLSVQTAIDKVTEYGQLQEKKAAEEVAKIQPTTPRNEEKKQEIAEKQTAQAPEGAKKYEFQFKVLVTIEQAKALGNFCRENGIELQRI